MTFYGYVSIVNTIVCSEVITEIACETLFVDLLQPNDVQILNGLILFHFLSISIKLKIILTLMLIIRIYAFIPYTKRLTCP